MSNIQCPSGGESIVLRRQGRQNPFRGDGDFHEIHADGVLDGVDDGGGDADDGVFADPAGAEGADLAGVFDAINGLLAGRRYEPG